MHVSSYGDRNFGCLRGCFGPRFRGPVVQTVCFVLNSHLADFRHRWITAKRGHVATNRFTPRLDTSALRRVGIAKI